MSHTYPGTNPLTISLSGPAGPGVIYNVGSYGNYSLPLVADAGDVRSAANLMAGVEGNRDAINFLSWRMPDWIAGGDYRSLYQSGVSIANYLSIDRSGVADSHTALLLRGGSNNGRGLDCYGSGNTPSAQFHGGATGGAGLVAYGSVAGGIAGVQTGAGGASYLDPGCEIFQGLLYFSSTQPAPTDVVPANMASAKHFAKAWGDFTTTGSNGAQPLNAGVNIASVSQISSGVIGVVFGTAMADTHYHVDVQTNYGSAYAVGAGGIVKSTTGFVINEFTEINGWGGASLSGVVLSPIPASLDISFAVFADQ